MATAPFLPEYLEPEGFEEVEENNRDFSELVDVLRREFYAADNAWQRLRDRVDLAHRYYEGRPFGNEIVGRSQVVLPDVQETVDYMTQSVLRTFVSGDRVVEFEATDESEEAAAEDATAAIGYNFMRQQDGYRVLHDWTVCGLLEKMGVIKTMMTTEERIVRETVQITDPVELENVPGDIESIEETAEGLVATVKMERTEKRFIDVPVPLGEFRYSPRARHEDEADYIAHVAPKSRSELVEMGFERELVYGLPQYSRIDDERGRWHESDQLDRETQSTPALEQCLLCEEYARIDLDGDGIAERVKVFRVENTILEWADGTPAIETVEEQPFAVFTPFPRPHWLEGWSLADKVMDIQLARSTVARQLMDGMYNANMPRPVVSESGASENTLDDILSPVPGSPIRVKTADAIVPYTTTFDVGKSLNVLEWITGERESRTGITRLNQGLDADALNKTATGTAMMQAQGQQQEEFIARNLAESFSRLMAKKYRLMRREGDPFKIKVDGQYKLVDPRSWPEDINLTIRVGLGTGSKDKRIQARMMLAPMLAEGFQQGQVEPRHLFHAIDGLVRDTGLGKGDDFWVDPDAPPEIDPQTGQPVQKQEKPDPQMLAMQAEQEREQAKLQFEQQKAGAQLQIQRESNQAQIEAQREKHALEMEQKREAADLDAQLRQQSAERDYALEIYKADKQAEIAVYQANLQAETAQRVSENRPGGDLDK